MYFAAVIAIIADAQIAHGNSLTALRSGLAVTRRDPASHASLSVFHRLLLLLLLLLAPGPGAAAELYGTVIKVADGDTVTVLDSAYVRHRVRLAGIDAPEKHQAFGMRARNHLESQVLGKEVIVVWNKHDRYGRIIGKVLTGKCTGGVCPQTRDAGLDQLHAGLAWHYKQYQRDQTTGERESYAAAEKTARAKHEGLWQDASPLPPWDYRRKARAAARMAHGGVSGS